MVDATFPPQRIRPRHVLAAIHKVERRGADRVTRDFEQREPDLLEHVLETLTLLHRDRTRSGLPPRTTRSLFRRAESLVLESIRACEMAVTPMSS